MIALGPTAMMVVALWRPVRCRRCQGMDCPGCIDGPLFCRRPDPAVDQGAEPQLEVQPEAPAEQPRIAPSDYQAVLAFWSGP